MACAVGLGVTADASAAIREKAEVPSFEITCGSGRTGPTLRLTREARRDGARTIVTVHVVNTGEADAEGARFSEDLSEVPEGRTVGETLATSGTLTYEKPMLRWTGDVTAGEDITVRYAVRTTVGRLYIPTVETDAGRTCQDAPGHPGGVRASADGAEVTADAPTGESRVTTDGRVGERRMPADTPGDTPAGPASENAENSGDVPPGSPAQIPSDTDTDTDTGAGTEAEADTRAESETGPARPDEKADARADTRADARPDQQRAGTDAALLAPIPFTQRYVNNFRGAITRAANSVVTCYPPSVPDCATRRTGSGNNNVDATFIDVDADTATFNSSTANLTLSAGAQVAYARLYWGARSQTTNNTAGLPAGNRLAPDIALRGQVSFRTPGSAVYRTIVAAAGDIGDTPDNITANGIVYGASADVTSIVTAAGAGTYTVANVQAARGNDGLGAFGGWSLVVAYRDATLPLRNITVFDGFLEQQNATPDTAITLSGIRTPTTGAVSVQIGEIAYDGDNAITGDSLSIDTTNGPLTVLSDALHPANNFFNSTIATLGGQVTDRNPAYTNTLGYDSNIVDASTAFRNNDTSARFIFSTAGDAYWPQAIFAQVALRQANIQATKSATVVGGGDPEPGSIIEYTITATNTGDDTAINVALTDPIPANTVYVPGSISVVTGPNIGAKTDRTGDDQGDFINNQVQARLGTGANAVSGGSLAPGQSTSVRFRVTLGANSPGTTVNNSATVEFSNADTPTQTGVTTGGTSTVVPVQVSSLAMLKTASPSTVTAAGRSVTYSYLVTNTGRTTLTGVRITETAFSGTGPHSAITCPTTTLAPQASTTCTSTYVTTQADIDAGGVTDTATATGTPPTGPAVTSDPSTVTITATPAPSLSLLKTASPTTVTAAGRTVTYSYLIVNTGNTTLTGVRVNSTGFSGTGTPPVATCPATTLAPQATTTCTSTYVITQADIDSGSIVNTATATGTPPTGPAVTSAPSSATVGITSAPALAMLKTASPITVTAAGRTVTYSYAIVNTGNTTLTGVRVNTIAFSGTGPRSVVTCPVTTLAPQASTTCTSTYVTNQADIDAGAITNTATASGIPPSGPVVTSTASTATVGVTSAPSVALLKTASPTTVTAAGRTVTYSYAVINTGNTTLTGVRVTDTTSGTGAHSAVTCPVTTLAPQATTTCTSTYVTTQADVDAGAVTNTATAFGTPPTGPAVASDPSTVTVTATPAAGLALLKTASPTTVTAAGRTVTYSYLVVNTGNTTLTGVSVASTSFSGIGARSLVTCPVTTLAPQASTTCTSTYVVRQADIDAGAVTNTATATGTPPTGPAVTSTPSTATVTATPAPGLALLKTASPTTVTGIGRTVTYSYLVINTGNLTLTGVRVTTTAFTGTGTPTAITCPVTTLAPQDSTTCTNTYAVTQADIDAGAVTNTATATGTPPTGPAVTSDDSTATVAAPATPGVALLKTAFPVTVTEAGQTITYSYAVVNTGNTTLTGVRVTTTAFTGTGTSNAIVCPVTTLAPQATTTCTNVYVVTQADIDAGTITNTATATGTPPTGPAVTSTSSTATVTAISAPGLALLKTAAPTTVVAAGRAISYTYLIFNTGNTTLTGIRITTTAFTGTGTPTPITCPATTLAPQTTTTCTSVYAITQADVDAGGVTNTATATAISPTGSAVTSGPSTATVTAIAAPAIAMLKTAFPVAATQEGQTIAYSYAVVNTGNTTLTGVRITDVSSGSNTPAAITCPTTTLAPQASTTCNGTRVITQADVDAGTVVNTATATGTPPTGPAVTSDPSTATVTLTAAPSLALQKTASPNVVVAAGQTVTYSYLVLNTGNTTLTGVGVTTTAFTGTGTPTAITCPVTTLAPQNSTTCTSTYAVTQADINAGAVTNTATATGTPPSGPAVTSDPSSAAITATAAPALALLKTASPTTVAAAGRTVTYSYLVLNTGNTTLTGLTVTTTVFTGAGTPTAITCPVTTLAPRASTTCTNTYVTTQADINAGSIVNTATATGTPPTGPAVTSDDSTATVTAIAAPAIAMLKTAFPVAATQEGQTIVYSYAVVNIGNTTLTGVAITDVSTASGTPGPITCPLTTLAPQESVTCNGTHVITQADIDAGTITNTATASGTPPTGPAVTSAPSTATVTLTAAPALALQKTASPNAVVAAGQTVTYSYLVLNTGNTTLTGVSVTTTAFTGTGTPTAITCPVTTLAPQNSTTCTNTYVVTQADINAGSIVNTATATGTPPTGPAVTSDASTATVTATAAPALALLKTASPTTVAAAGRTVTYSYLVLNTGNTTLTGVTVTTTAFTGTGTPTAIVCPVTTLAPRASTTCTNTYVTTQADINAGTIVNTATATGTPPTGPAVTSDPSAATITVIAAPAIALLKTAFPTASTQAGETITYSYAIVNTGNLTLTGVGVTTTAFTGTGTPTAIVCPVTTLAPQDSTTCTNTYVTTQADIDAGTVTNTATASGTPPTGPAVTSDPSTATVTGDPAPRLALLKTASPSTVTAAGRTVTYSYMVVNTGNATLTGVTVTTTAFTGTGTPTAITCPVTTLAPQDMTTCTNTYVTTQDDIDAGSIVNTATATGTPPVGPAVTSDPSTATVAAPAAPTLALLKTGTPNTVTAAGQTVTYAYLVSNTGNTTLTGVDVTETAFTGTGTPTAITCPVTTLAPQARTVCSNTYVVTQADIDAGTIVDTAVATGTPPAGPAVASPPSTNTITAVAAPAVALLKTASPNTATAAGQTITYAYLVTNTGNTTLTGVDVTTTAFTGTGTPTAIVCPVTTLAPQDSTTCTSTYVLTQADVDAGTVVNTATATGTPPTGPAVTSDASTATVTITADPNLALLKTASPATLAAAGRTVTYSYLLVNTGNTTLTGVDVTDTAFSGAGTPPVITCPVTTLAPRDLTTCTGTYVTTQADVDAGTIVNTAVATGTPPTGPAIASPSSTATVTIPPAPTLALLKTASPTTVTAAGQTVTYAYLVANTGNTTLTGVDVATTAFTGTGTPTAITCPVTTLAPQARTVCSNTYVTTQADIDAGTIVNTATATGTPPTGPAVTSDPSTATVAVIAAPALALLKTASPATATAAGQTITYEHLVTNTGNTTLTGVDVTTTAFTGSGTAPVVTCPVTTLAPQEATTCTGSYVLTQADVDTGTVTNTATASGTPPTGPAVTSDPSTATVTATPDPELALLKTASPTTVIAAGRTVVYSYLLVNTGNTTLNGVDVTESVFSGTGTPPVITCPVTTLAPQDTTTCTSTYVVTQADVDAGAVVNIATATATPPGGSLIAAPPSTATVTITPAPDLALLKTGTPNTVTAAGQTVDYSYLVFNTGNTTLTGVDVTDTTFSGTGTPPVITCPAVTLAPQDTTTCTGTYVTTQADIDAGTVVNTATATGTSPGGTVATSAPSTATITATPAPGVALLKTASPTTVAAAGRTVVYSYLVVNTGNVTLTGVDVTGTSFSGSGPAPVITCPAVTLAPQDTTTCTSTYVTTQADIDAGGIVNTALATGTPPTGPAVVSDPSTATVTATPAPSLALLKTAAPATVAAAGRTVIYAYLVVNTGNATLTGVNVTDTTFTGTGPNPAITCPVTTLAPQDAVVCNSTYVITQADINAGAIVNTALATGTPPEGPAVTSDPSTVTVVVEAAPGLALLKTVSPSAVTAAGRSLTYSYTIINTGNATLTDVGVIDTAFTGTGPAPVITCPVTVLNPQDTTVCTGTYVTTQADIDAGSITNTAVATGTPPTGPAVVSDPSTATVGGEAAPGLALLKTVTPSVVTAAGRQVTYSYTIVNTGNATLTGVDVNDTAFTGTGPAPVITCPAVTLAPQDTVTCTSTYLITQADIDAGGVVNTAVASGTTPAGAVVTSEPSTATVVEVAAPALALLKTASPSTFTAADRPVTYSYTVVNTGNTTLTGVSATDTSFSGTGTPPVITCPVTTLAPQDTVVCTGTYITTQADVNAGVIVNTATASATPPVGPPVTSAPSTVAITGEPAPSLALLKTASPSTVTAAGREVVYSYAVVNTGNLTLTGVTVADVTFSGTGTPGVIVCPVTTLAPQETTTCTSTYVTTQADVDAGVIVNTAVAAGVPPGETVLTSAVSLAEPSAAAVVTSDPSTVVVTAEPAPSLALLKTASPRTVARPGEAGTVTYSYAIVNTGNTTLTALTVVDTDFSGTGTPPQITCPVRTLVPQATTTCTGTYVTTQDDVDAGAIVNTAVASGTPPVGPPVSSEPSTATVAAELFATLTLSKSASPSVVSQAGQTITYSYAVVNTGNRTLTGVNVTDTFFTGSGGPPVITCPAVTLAPDGATTCTGTYLVTQADINAGTITNTAVASGTPVGGSPVTSPLSSTTVAVEVITGLILSKTAEPGTITAPGVTVTYTYLVTNAGNATLTGVEVRDSFFSGSGTPPVVTCPVTTLAPQGSTACTSRYVTTQADVNAGTIVNTATATATSPGGQVLISNPSTATVTAATAPGLALLKTASPSTVAAAGRTVLYSYDIVNTGNATLTGVGVTDTSSGSGAPTQITCPVTTLAPQDTTTCTGTYVTTQVDINAGSIVNTAIATGTPPSGPAVASGPSTVTVEVEPAPDLALLKTADPTALLGPNQTITYSYRVLNTGNATLSGVSVTDTSFSGSGTPPQITCPATTLAPQDTFTCTSTYVTTQADVNAGAIINTAVATGTPPFGPVITSEPSTSTVSGGPAPSLALLKTVSPSVLTAAGRTLIYSYLIVNTGNTTLTQVDVRDTSFSGTGTPGVITCPTRTLQPQESTSCTSSYVSTQEDIEAGTVVNTAQASGVSDSGPVAAALPRAVVVVASAPSTVAVTVLPVVSLALLKTAAPSTLTAPGQTITYSYLIVNTGNTRLSGVDVTTTVFTGTGTPSAITCPVTTLAPQDSTTCTNTYVTTQADVDAGAIVNAATASGVSRLGIVATSDVSAATVTAVPTPALTLLKSASPSTVREGQTITYFYLVVNTGNSTLNGVGVTDLSSASGTPPQIVCPQTRLAPQDSTICTSTYVATRADIRSGAIVNTATASGSLFPGAVTSSNPSAATVTTTASGGGGDGDATGRKAGIRSDSSTCTTVEFLGERRVCCERRHPSRWHRAHGRGCGTGLFHHSRPHPKEHGRDAALAGDRVTRAGGEHGREKNGRA
ncbi:beta strand repeat-containing protein [Streptosporangium longisporum]|uniref:beta strand repeat-containing protein n=1 Tax=Streptosporangium longisporum TaxID=46187 RepID=UPI0039A54F77